jgi:hypothetical protein
MDKPDPLAKLRRLLPWLAAAVIVQAGLFVFAAWSKRLPPVWPIVVGDLGFTLVLLFVLWRLLGRRR